MRAASVALAAALSLLAAGASAATFQIVVLDGAGEGFNDPTPRAPVPGNPGVTLGQQRLNLFNAAAAVWGAALRSNVTIRVGSAFDPLLPCDPGGAVLGAAGPEEAYRDFAGAPVAATWYVVAVRNAIVGNDANAGVDDIGATFNSTLDAGTPCLGGASWWYGIGTPPQGNTIDLYTTVLHELGHGLGVLSLHNLGTGAKFLGFDDAYLRLLFDEDTDEGWSTMSNAERLVSQVNTGDLVWTGANANATVPGFNTGVHPGNNRLRMYAPFPIQPGSSVSHWDTALSPNELMEPILTSTSRDYATYRQLRDVGWVMQLIFKDGFESVDDDFWNSALP